MASLKIFNVQRFSTHDGAGIRTNIFFKGCPLRCRWCSNPESQSTLPEILYDPSLCRKFRDCTRVPGEQVVIKNDHLSIRRKQISDPEIFRNICPAKAITVSGEERSPEDLIREIEKDLPFYSRGSGGVTFTGGEPFSQDSLLVDLAYGLKQKGIHLSVETSLHVPWIKIEPFTGLIDDFLVDVKHTDEEKYKKYTGGRLSLFHENLKKLIRTGAHIVARVPVIPGFNHSIREMIFITEYILGFGVIREMDLFPYHLLGKRKYQMLGRKYNYGDFASLQEKDLEPYYQYALQKGLIVNIGG